jgi:AMP nucleosidase
MGGVTPLELARTSRRPSWPTSATSSPTACWRRPDRHRPLALFDALRTDFSLARLRHYTGTPPEHFPALHPVHQLSPLCRRIRRLGMGQQVGQGRYTALRAPAGFMSISAARSTIQALVADSAWRKHQMPAYHLDGPDGGGITLVNIGVGPSNAKTITDHLAVLRPEAWLMIGHCGGLRPSQRIGDYVLAHAYLRDDHILDDVLPVEIPVPAIAEVQVALQKRCRAVSGETGIEQLKARMRTGTVVTTDDRNWELRYTDSALRFSQSRAVGIDMESATIAAQGYRFRVPYGTLLCVSATSRSTASSSCPDRPTASTNARSPSISRSASARATMRDAGATAPQPKIARLQRAAVPLTDRQA